MVYGDLQFIDVIIFAGIAAFLIYRLRNVLGKRTGYEKKEKIGENKGYDDKKIVKKIPELKENQEKLSIAYDLIPDFDHKVFLESAKFAFETIINAFNNGDKKTLKTLLNKDVLSSFSEAIDSKNNNKEYQFYSLVVDSVKDVAIEGSKINITLNIISEQFKDNDDSTIVKKNDTWTFQKEIKSQSPIWFLSST